MADEEKKKKVDVVYSVPLSAEEQRYCDCVIGRCMSEDDNKYNCVRRIYIASSEKLQSEVLRMEDEIKKQDKFIEHISKANEQMYVTMAMRFDYKA